MFTFYSCGEQDIEDNGICISLSSTSVPRDISELYKGIVDSLLGVAEFVSECGYDFAEVSFDFVSDYLVLEEEMCFNDFIQKEENKKLSEIYFKYCDCEWGDPITEGGTTFVSVAVNNKGVTISEDDLFSFTRLMSEEEKKWLQK